MGTIDAQRQNGGSSCAVGLKEDGMYSTLLEMKKQLRLFAGEDGEFIKVC